MADTEEEEYESSHSDEPKSTSFSSLKDLKNLIHENNLFFDRLVDLVPARFYIYPEDPPHPGYYGMSKSAKAAAKKATKENLKKAHRARLDPENYASTLELVKRKAEKEEQEKLKEGEAEQHEIREDNKAATYEELRKRLHQRIEKLQASRKEKKDSQKGKRKREEVAGTQSTRDSVPQEAPSAKQGKEDVEKVKKDPEEDKSTNLEFGRVKISVGNEISKDRNKKLKESKAHLLEKAQKLQSTMQDPEKGQVVATEHSWSAATSRAAGIKVLDNPKLLKQSLKKDNKQHQKSVQKWKERTKLKEKAVEERQQVRKEHITQRSQQKKDRLIAKREKKLLRPGFEGRKDGFINI